MHFCLHVSKPQPVLCVQRRGGAGSWPAQFATVGASSYLFDDFFMVQRERIGDPATAATGFVTQRGEGKTGPSFFLFDDRRAIHLGTYASYPGRLSIEKNRVGMNRHCNGDGHFVLPDNRQYPVDNHAGPLMVAQDSYIHRSPAFANLDFRTGLDCRTLPPRIHRIVSSPTQIIEVGNALELKRCLQQPHQPEPIIVSPPF
ncbi:hypothetical protein IW262DRAFT_1293684 [Armillaria fumosa]|nr:hypothetical protein IW262DRAFT_1293684 [Armillaria fumosa]